VIHLNLWFLLIISPFLSYIIRYLKQQGIQKIILAVSYQWEKFQALFPHLDYSIENTPLGTGGAILQALKKYHLNRALIINGDTFFPVNIQKMLEFHENNFPTDLTMALKHQENTARYGSVLITPDNQITHFSEKGKVCPGYINGGLYIIKNTIFSEIKTPYFSFETDLLPTLLNTKKIMGYPDTAYFIDIGIPEDYARAQQELSALK